MSKSVEYTGCDLTYRANAPCFERNPSTLTSETPRPITINGKKQLVIDMHAHCQFPEIMSLIKDRPELGGKNPFSHGGWGKEQDIEERLNAMNVMGVDIQILSISVFHHHHWAEYSLAEDLCQIQNEKMTEICALYPDRFVPLSIVALQHPELAATQLEYNVKEMGHRGAMITAALDGEELSDERFHPFWVKAEELDVPIFIHPRHFREGAPRFKGQGFLSNIIGNPLDTTVALAHLIYEGTLDKFPNLKIVAAHGGGFLASNIGRFDHGHNSDDRGGRGAEKKAPSEYLNQIYFDTVVFGSENLHHLIRECGAGQLVLGTDYPAGMSNINPVAHLLSVEGLSDEDIESILSGTVKKLLKI